MDLSGMRFGRLLVEHRADDYVAPGGYKTSMWQCICDCGNRTIVRGKSLLGGVTKSCGCYARENMSNVSKKHGGYGTRLYAVWDSMKQRCYNANHKAYHNYGGRGIQVCEEWFDFCVFREWAYLNGYDDSAPRGKLTLDRVDVDKDYSPNNCRWADVRKQSNNKRDTIWLEFDGERRTLSEWADETGIKYCTIWKRYKNNKSAEEILKPTTNTNNTGDR